MRHPYGPDLPPRTGNERLARVETELIQLKTDIAEVKDSLKPITEAFQQYKGFKGAVYLFMLIVAAALGIGIKEVVSWIGWVFHG